MGIVIAIAAVLASALTTITVYRAAAKSIAEPAAFRETKNIASGIVAGSAFIALCLTDSPLLLVGLLASIVGMRASMNEMRSENRPRPIGRV